MSIRPAPPTSIATPATSRLRSVDSGMAMSSRSAVTGAIRAARRAGRYAASVVTPTPTTYDATTVSGRKTSGCPERSRPKLANSARMPIARTTPSASPRVAPTVPSSTASNSTDRVTCLREAPSARSRASSRLRCATRMEKVFTIRKLPTTSAMPAKTSRKTLMNRIASITPVAESWAAWSPVTASNPAGRRAATWFRSSDCETPGAAVTQASLNPSTPRRKRSCAVRVSKTVIVAPLVDPPSVKSARPTSRGVRVACLPDVASVTVSPSR